MEYFWYVVAATGAGVSTGLAGLSAAAVMVPILIVLCPAFAGTGGAYQATAIALASDVLASVASSLVYLKNKNVDFRRSWIVMVCVVAMSVAGSIAASFTGNVVLGTFSLVLCIFIGLRFLIQPDPKGRNLVPKGAALDKKAVALSILFGIAIGFVVGYVGSGGGLMMLLVFTMFLGMDRKTAVGTSTLTMSVTALIAFASHAVLDNQILLEHWDVLIICGGVATVAALVSAQFANKVNNKVVGLVTGAVLTVLGIVLIILHFVA